MNEKELREHIEELYRNIEAYIDKRPLYFDIDEKIIKVKWALQKYLEI